MLFSISSNHWLKERRIKKNRAHNCEHDPSSISYKVGSGHYYLTTAMIIQLRESPKPLTSPKRVYKILQAVLEAESAADQDKEHLWVFYLTNRHTIKALELVSLGTLNACLVHPREVFTQAIAYRCASIIIAHNHPSGEKQASNEDIASTKRLIEAGRILGIELLDHVIIIKQGYTSLKEQGVL